jgi:hypothetical protein
VSEQLGNRLDRHSIIVTVSREATAQGVRMKFFGSNPFEAATSFRILPTLRTLNPCNSIFGLKLRKRAVLGSSVSYRKRLDP